MGCCIHGETAASGSAAQAALQLLYLAAHLDTSISHHWPASTVKAYSKLPAALIREPNRICMGGAVRWWVGGQGGDSVSRLARESGENGVCSMVLYAR